MLPFGETVLAWRLARCLTQAELARRARMSRPNLSAVERGDREVTLRTLRALALALEVRPGLLADGEPPAAPGASLGRAALERVARSAARGEPLADPQQRELARLLRGSANARLAAAGGKPGPRSTRRSADQSWLLLKARATPATAASLVDRLAGHVKR
jgi:transcriptional regulator with XRE-family HTH domain